jgi:hypothetical protein
VAHNPTQGKFRLNSAQTYTTTTVVVATAVVVVVLVVVVVVVTRSKHTQNYCTK